VLQVRDVPEPASRGDRRSMPAMPLPASSRRIWFTREWQLAGGGAANSRASAGCGSPSLCAVVLLSNLLSNDVVVACVLE